MAEAAKPMTLYDHTTKEPVAPRTHVAALSGTGKKGQVVGFTEDDVVGVVEKQDVLTGTAGQVVGFDSAGKATAAEVGGVNLYTGTRDFSGDAWIKTGWTADDQYNGLSVYKLQGPSHIGIYQRLNVLKGEIFTLSAYLKADSSCSVRYWTGKTGESDSTNPTGFYIQIGPEWKRVAVPFVVLKDCEINPRFDGVKGHEIFVCGLKLERGSVATDWSPAPEDLASQSALDAALERIAALEAKMNVSADSHGMEAAE